MSMPPFKCRICIKYLFLRDLPFPAELNNNSLCVLFLLVVHFTYFNVFQI